MKAMTDWTTAAMNFLLSAAPCRITSHDVRPRWQYQGEAYREGGITVSRSSWAWQNGQSDMNSKRNA